MLALGLGDPAAANEQQAQNENQTPLMSQQEFVDKVTGGLKVNEMDPAYVRASRLVARELGVLPGQQVLLVNGRVSIFFVSEVEAHIVAWAIRLSAR
jgi:hypothetical protein